MIAADAIRRLRVAIQTVTGGSRWSGVSKVDAACLDEMLCILTRDARLKEAMLEELRGAARVCAPSRFHRSSSVDVAELIRSTTDALRPAAAHGGVTLLARCAATSVIVPGDAADVTHIVSRLLACAIASSACGDTVDCQLSVDGDWLMLNVTVHRRADDMASPANELETGAWTELGLATVRELVELHGGVLDVEIDRRSCRQVFDVRLPGDRGTA